jgi:hypothetical protein
LPIDAGARDQASTIARATFDGFLQSDLMPSGMQAPALIWAAAFLVAPAIFFPVQNLAKYPFIRRYHPEMLELTLWNDRLLFLMMSAGAVGLVSVVLWDTLFPARRDAFVLTPLPVPLPVQMVGRLMGLMILCLSFVVALNAVPAVAFPLTASGTLLEMPRAMLAHFATTACADAFVFFSVTSLQGIVILALGRRSASRLASAAQAGAVGLLLLSLLFIGGIRSLTTDALVRGDVHDRVLAFVPSAWFLGLYEWLAGSPRPLMAALAGRAALATVLPVGVTVAIYAFGYRRLLARAVETPPRSTRSLITRGASALIRGVFVRRPQGQAICAFVLRAISRSGRHSMLMSIYVGAGLAMMITFVLPGALRSGPGAFAAPSVVALALPLVLSVALACGVRILITIPADMAARWVFQTAAITPRHVDAAAHKALVLIVVPIVMATAALTAGPLWGVRIAGLHAIYCGALSLLLCEVLLVGYRGIPLTRPYVPGGSRFHLLWAAYLTAFLTYTVSSAELERTLLQWTGPRGVLDAAAVIAGFALGFWAWRKFKLRHATAVPFDAEMPDDQMFQGFNLTETYAAQSVAPRANGSAKFPV